MRVAYSSLRMEFSTGYHINKELWDEYAGCSIGMDESDAEINNGLKLMAGYVKDTISLFMVKEEVPNQKKFRETFQMIRSGNIRIPPKLRRAHEDNHTFNSIIKNKNNKTDKGRTLSQRTKAVNKYISFWDIYHEFEAFKRNYCTDKTQKKYRTIRNNLLGLRAYKRKMGLEYFDITFDFLDENGLQNFTDYLYEEKGYANSTINKDIVMLKVFIRWAYNRKYHQNLGFEKFRCELKCTHQRVIFLSMEELKVLMEFQIPQNKKNLEYIRDVFLFMCFTGLRYSDVANLRRYDIVNDHIEITTIKTHEILIIDLNKYSRAILKKYENVKFKNDAALPVISNQKMNQRIHDLCRLVGFNRPVRYTYYRGAERIDMVKPKYEFISTHTGRRSFICNALCMGIPVHIVMKWTGHCDYKAMRPYIDATDNIMAEAMRKFDFG